MARPKKLDALLDIYVKIAKHYNVKSVATFYKNIPFVLYKEFVKNATTLHKQYTDMIVNIINQERYQLEIADRWLVLCKTAEYDEYTYNVMSNMIKENNIDEKEFKKAIKDVICRKDFKKNTLRLVGAPNSGKSLIAKALVSPFLFYSATMSGCAGEHYFGAMINKSIILIEELWVVPATADDYKTILSGYPIHVNKKHVTEREELEETPIIVTGNHTNFGRGFINEIDENALQIRTYTFNFETEFCKTDKKLLNKHILFYLIN